jgi:hypothetical protein
VCKVVLALVSNENPLVIPCLLGERLGCVPEEFHSSTKSLGSTKINSLIMKSNGFTS